jgi:predicted AAA+ superfamily ATPase
VLVLDEIQKILAWSETVKRLWDEDTHARRPLRVVLLGSSPLLIAQGLTESLACRYPGQMLSYTKMLG